MAKKIHGVLKGVAIAGTAIGGGSVLGSANLAYAAELPESMDNSSGEVALEISQEHLTEVKAELEQAVNDLAQANTNQENLVETTGSEQGALGTLEQEQQAAQSEENALQQAYDEKTAEITAEQGKVADIDSQIAAAQNDTSQQITAEEGKIQVAETEKTENGQEINSKNSELTQDRELLGQDKGALETLNGEIQENADALEAIGSDIQSTQDAINAATANKEKAEGELNGINSDLETNNNTLAAKENEFANKGYNNAELQSLVDDANDKLKDALTAIKNNHPEGSGKYDITKDEYTTYLRPVAEALIKYYLVQNGDVAYADLANVQINYWDKGENNISAYDNSHYCVRYVDSAGTLYEQYFDYVTCDKDGNSLFNGAQDIDPDDSTQVTGINLLTKLAPVYRDINGKSTDTFSYYTDKQRAELLSSQQKNCKKSVEINDTTYYYIQRTGWDTQSGGRIKGSTIYTNKELQSYISTRDSLTKEIANLNSTIADLQTDLANKQEEVNGYATEITNLNGTLATQTGKQSELLATKASLESQKQELEGDISTLSQSIEDLEKAVAKLIARQDELDTQIGTAQGNITSLNEGLATKVSELNGEKEILNGNITSLTNEQAAIGQQKEALEEKIVKLDEDINKKLSDVKDYMDQIAKGELEIDRLKALIDKLTATIKEIEAALAEKAALQAAAAAAAPSGGGGGESSAAVSLPESFQTIATTEVEAEGTDVIVNAAATQQAAPAQVNAAPAFERLEDAQVPLGVNLEESSETTGVTSDGTSVTIEKDKVPLAGAKEMTKVKWYGTTLPTIGVMTGAIGAIFHKNKKQDEENL